MRKRKSFLQGFIEGMASLGSILEPARYPSLQGSDVSRLRSDVSRIGTDFSTVICSYSSASAKLSPFFGYARLKKDKKARHSL